MKIEPFIFRALGDRELDNSDVLHHTPLNDNEGNLNSDLAEEIVEVTYSEADLIAARNEGFQQGLTEGTNTSIEAEKQLTTSISNFTNKIEIFLNSYYNIIEVEKKITTQAVIDIANKITLLYPNENIIEVIKTMVDDIYDVAITKPKISIYVHENLKEKTQEYIKKIFSNDKYNSVIEIISNSDVSITDFYLEWNDGGVQRNTEKIWNEIEKILNHKRLETNTHQTEIENINDDNVDNNGKNKNDKLDNSNNEDREK